MKSISRTFIIPLLICSYLSAGFASCGGGSAITSDRDDSRDGSSRDDSSRSSEHSASRDDTASTGTPPATGAHADCRDVDLTAHDRPMSKLPLIVQQGPTCYAAGVLNNFYGKIMADGLCNKVPPLPSTASVDRAVQAKHALRFSPDSAWTEVRNEFLAGCHAGTELSDAVHRADRSLASLSTVPAAQSCGAPARAPLTGDVQCSPANVPCGYLQQSVPDHLTWAGNNVRGGDQSYTRKAEAHFNSIAEHPGGPAYPLYAVIRAGTLKDGQTNDAGGREPSVQHAVTLVGQRWNTRKNRCEFLVRNSYAPDTSYFRDWEVRDPARGELWVDADRLSVRDIAAPGAL